MAYVTVDADWQVEIPQEIRLDAQLHVGQRMSVVAKGGVISLVPQSSAAALRGLAKGHEPTGYRDKTDRL